MKKYFGKYNSNAEIVADLDAGNLEKPYVAVLSAGTLDYNTQVPTPPYNQRYLTIEAMEDGTIVLGNQSCAVDGCKIYYSINDGAWTETNSEESSFSVQVNSGDTVRWKVTGYDIESSEPHTFIQFFNGTNELSFNVYGNIMSMLYGDAFSAHTAFPSTTPQGIFEQFFVNCTGLVSAEHIVLPSNTKMECYKDMFNGCTSLTTAPELLATHVDVSAYVGMFYECQSLTFIKCLAESAEDSSYDDGFVDWVFNVAASGTFVKSANNTEWAYSSASGIPEGWTVEAV